MTTKTDAARECAEEQIEDELQRAQWIVDGVEPPTEEEWIEILAERIRKHFPPSVPCDELRSLAQNWITKANMLRWENGKMEAKDLLEIISKYEATK